ncbi:hypothetical protein A4A49_65622 [Nicotiana attenuata]|uniref:SWIM-type domain-containing protein n=1 Tax=Nicotiana attenuata TaxID=49451 RepID=A0A314KQ87_NICAT|nr:hypothetical protein A4A49_65622 [Nicotiana attenuata]
MEDIPIMIQHGRVWDSGSYVNYSINGVVIYFCCKYDELVQVIAKHIGICNGTNLIDIKYKVKERYTPIEVVNDMSVRLYIELKRRNLEFTEISLCIAMKEKNTGLCSSDAKPRGTLCDDYLGLDIPEMVCVETMLMIGDGTYQNDIGVLSDGIISDPLNQEIEEGQLYQDNETLYAAMNHYAIRKKFQFMVKPSNEHIHTVYEEGIRYMVNLGNRTCSCKRFEMDEIPCPHALAIVTSKGMDPYEFCSIYYTKGYLMKTYEEYVHPIPSERNWNIPTDILEESVSPPVGKIQPGRPKKKRGLYVWERHAKKVKNTCKQCGHECHNRRTCRNVPRRD